MAEAGEGERQVKMEAAKDFLNLAVELSFPDNSALERETMRQRTAKLQDTLLVRPVMSMMTLREIIFF